tara:strand:- start:1556 stop:1786 length:231 start_codon:yes stop_codon:yes gene_type:complete
MKIRTRNTSSADTRFRRWVRAVVFILMVSVFLVFSTDMSLAGDGGRLGDVLIGSLAFTLAVALAFHAADKYRRLKR